MTQWKLGDTRTVPIWVFDLTGAPVLNLKAPDFAVTVIWNEAVKDGFPFVVRETNQAKAKGRYSVDVKPDMLGDWEIRPTVPAVNAQGWSDLLRVTRRGVDDLAFPLTSGQGVAVDGSGNVSGTFAGTPDVNIAKWLGSTPSALVAGDVSVSPNWSNVQNPSAAVNLSGTTISTSQQVAAVSGNVGGNVIGSVGSVATGGITAASLAAGATYPSALRTGTAQAGTTTTITLDAGASSANGDYKNCYVVITGGTGANQGAVLIFSYNGTSKVASLYGATPFAIAPDNTSQFAIYQLPGLPGPVTVSAFIASAISSAAFASGAITSSAFASGALGSVWEEATASHSTSSTFGKLLGSILLSAAGNVKADLEEWRASVPNALQGGRVDSYLGAVAAGVIAAASFAAGALGAVWDELTSGHVVANTFGKLLGLFSFSVSGNVKSDVEEWRASVPSSLTVAGNVQVDVEQWRFQTPLILENQRIRTTVERWGDGSGFGNPASVNDLISGRVDSVASVVSDKTGYSLTSAERDSIASTINKRDIELDEPVPQHSHGGMIQKLTCAVDASSGIALVVKQTDGTTSYTQPLTTSDDAKPITKAG